MKSSAADTSFITKKLKATTLSSESLSMLRLSLAAVLGLVVMLVAAPLMIGLLNLPVNLVMTAVGLVAAALKV